MSERLPALRTPIPGPRSRALARRLARVESRNITATDSPHPPIFWERARGANVHDVDGNVFIDLTGGFGVAAAGHANRRVARAIARQAARLPHALGDVYPAPAKVRLLERLAAIAPGDLEVAILASAGAEAVEAALKTALMRTGRPGILAFEHAYHGLTYGALATTSRDDFRAPFRAQLFAGVRFAPFPHRSTWQDAPQDDAELAAAALERVRSELHAAERSSHPIGPVIVEPMPGRGGILIPPAGFLAGLRGLCDEHGALLVFDEIYTGFGRTGRWFACQHDDVVPDIMTVGKAFTGALPLSAAIGTRDVMDAWPPSRGEAIHTSTFLGNPVACAAALAQIEEIEQQGLVARADTLGDRIHERMSQWRDRYPLVRDVRGRGLFQGIELSDAAAAGELVAAALQRGILLLGEGAEGNVLALTPPLVITERQLDFALEVIEELLGQGERRGPGN